MADHADAGRVAVETLARVDRERGREGRDLETILVDLEVVGPA